MATLATSASRIVPPPAAGSTTFSRSRIAPPRVERVVAGPWRRSQPTDTSYYVLGVPFVDHVAACRGVRRCDGLDDVLECHAEEPKPVRVGRDLVFDREPTDAGNVRHAGNGAELWANVPILDRAEPAQVESSPFDRVPEDLASRGGVRRQLSRGAVGHLPVNLAQSIGHSPSRLVNRDGVLEDDTHCRETNIAGRTDDSDAVDASQSQGQRIGHLVLDLSRPVTFPLGEDDHLVL